MNKKPSSSEETSKATKLLLAIVNFGEAASINIDAFLFSMGSARQLMRNISVANRENYRSTFQGLCRHGYIKKVNENQFLITPKALRKIRISQIEASDWNVGKWDGFWRIISFDIPESKKRERNILRALIRRKGFIGIQNSVFIAPFADFEALAELRKDLKIEKYVSFFIAKSYQTDDDSLLKKRFKLH